MKFTIPFVFTSVGLVLSISGKYPDPANEDTINSEEVNKIFQRMFKKSISAYPQYSENDVNPEGTLQEPCRMTLPTLDLSAIADPQDFYNDDGGQEYLPGEVEPPKVPSAPYTIPFNTWTPYDLDYLAQAYNNYDMQIYPNPVPSVRSLPPVISTHIHETIPERPQIDDGFNMNGLAESDVYFSPYVRAVRSREDDFLDQLEKDAMIPNILPTMPFPYLRTAGLANYRPHEGGPVALFPPGAGSNCVLPFLVSCTPKVYSGTLSQNAYAYGGNPMQSALASYRKGGGNEPTHVKTR